MQAEGRRRYFVEAEDEPAHVVVDVLCQVSQEGNKLYSSSARKCCARGRKTLV